MAKIMFTIIFPTYGVEEYLREAVEDIRGQTYENWELVIVDDASPDACGILADSLALEDERIRVIHKEANEGLSEARNTGLKAATGEYVLFLDPDDRFSGQLLAAIETEIAGCHTESDCQPDVVVFGITEDYYNGNRLVFRQSHTVYGCRLTGKKEIYPLTVALEKETLYGYAWNKSYRRAFLMEHGFSFRTIPHVEDILFNCDVFDAAEHISNLPVPYVHYRNPMKDNNGRLTAKYLPGYFDLQKKRIKRLMRQYMMNRTVVSREICREALVVFAAEYARSFLSMLERMLSAGYSCREVRRRAEEERKDILFCKLLPHFQMSGVMEAALYMPVKMGFFGLAIAEARVIGGIKKLLPGFYNRMKQNR